MNMNFEIINQLRSFTEASENETPSKIENTDFDNTRRELKKSKPIAKHIKWIKGLMWTFSQEMESVKIKLLEEEKIRCGNILMVALDISTTCQHLALQLKDTLLSEELSKVSAELTQMLSNVLTDPRLILMRLLEFGFYMFEIESILDEQIMSKSFVKAACDIMKAVPSLSSGQIVRQVYYIHMRLLGSFMQENPLNRLQKCCKCRIAILPKSDIRSNYCPLFYRAFEVNFEKSVGRPFELSKQLSALHDPIEENPVKLAVTILRMSTSHKRIKSRSGCIPCICS